MREQDLSASLKPHSLGTFLAEQESAAPGRDSDCHIALRFAMTSFNYPLPYFIIIRNIIIDNR